MSGDAEQLGGAAEDAARRPRGGLSEVEEELRFHLDQMVERLRAEGYGRADAEAEARRRFGDLESLAEECAAQRAGPLVIALRWLITSTVSAWVVVVAALVAVVLTDGPPLALMFVLAPVSLAGGACALLAAVRPEWSGLTLRAGHRILGLLCLLACATFLKSSGDCMHSLWSVQFPLVGLLFGSGVVLVRVWPEDRRRRPDLLRCRSGATVTLLAVLVLGSLPMLLTLRPTGRFDGSTLPALLEVARYGFGGEVPSSMQPHAASHVERGLGSPPRIVTVTMASTLLAAASWVLFVLLALIGRAIREGAARRSFFLVSPLFLGSAALPLALPSALYDGIWRNEPWLVRAYGPTLLAAAVATLVLLLAVRRAADLGGRAG